MFPETEKHQKDNNKPYYMAVSQGLYHEFDWLKMILEAV